MGKVANGPISAGARPRRGTKEQPDLLDLEIPARADCLVAARQAVSQLAQDLHLSTEATCDLLLAVGEACNNAILHGSRSSEGPVRVRCRLDKPATKDRALQVDIANQGNGFVPEKGTRFAMPDAEEMTGHGRGLPLMQQLVDDMQILCENGSTVVRLTKKIS